MGLRSRNAWLAWQLDNAVLAFGRHVEHELESVKARSEPARNFKRRQKLAELLGLEKPTYVFNVDVPGQIQ